MTHPLPSPALAARIAARADLWLAIRAADRAGVLPAAVLAACRADPSLSAAVARV